MKNIVITGAGKGIGLELVKTLSAQNRVFCISRNVDQLNEIAESSKNIIVFKADISNENDLEKLTAKFQIDFAKIDVLINNAGALVNKPFEQITVNDMSLMFQTNVIGLMRMCQIVLPFLIKDSHIVNIGSMGGFQGSVKFPGLSVYSASKGAVAAFSECLAEELKEKNISVNCLALGAAQTEMLSQAFPGYRAPLSAENMASFIADFSINGHRYINGKTIPVSLSTP